MPIAPFAKSTAADFDSASPDQSCPIPSDIRALSDNHRGIDLASEPTLGEVTGSQSLFTLGDVIQRYANLQGRDSNILYALQRGDLPNALVGLIRQNSQLRAEVESCRSDFEELRSMNVALQDQADARLGVADDQRLELLDALDQTRSELMDLESRAEQVRLDREGDLETLRLERDALQLEIAELRLLRT